jgi:hypothetical protein
MIATEFGFEKDDLKLFFDDHEMKDDEILKDLVALGFTKNSPLRVEIANSFPVSVECWDGEIHQFAVQSETRMLQPRKRIGRKIEIPFGLISVECDGGVVNDYDVVEEVCVDGKRLKAKMNDSSLCDVFSPSGNITEESVEKMIEEIKTMPLCELREIATKESTLSLSQTFSSNPSILRRILLFQFQSIH